MLGCKTKRRQTHRVTATFEVLHPVKLSAADLATLAALCETKGFEHIVCPSGEPARAESWRRLAQRLREATP